mmetsp:Transcript_5862/g.10976  ORF Transcript_5862/g.10976 Transcript_5862/m.10976 type:complete len:225 (-) Transcript_5862:568-1242(-)
MNSAPLAQVSLKLKSRRRHGGTNQPMSSSSATSDATRGGPRHSCYSTLTWAEDSDGSDAAQDRSGYEQALKLGISSAERGDFLDALTKLRAADLSIPGDVRGTLEHAKLLEMLAQVLMELGESHCFATIQVAERAVAAAPEFGLAWLTLGRAQVNFGELGMALDSFTKAQAVFKLENNTMPLEEVEVDLKRTRQLLMDVTTASAKRGNNEQGVGTPCARTDSKE